MNKNMNSMIQIISSHRLLIQCKIKIIPIYNSYKLTNKKVPINNNITNKKTKECNLIIRRIRINQIKDSFSKITNRTRVSNKTKIISRIKINNHKTDDQFLRRRINHLRIKKNNSRLISNRIKIHHLYKHSSKAKMHLRLIKQTGDLFSVKLQISRIKI